MKKGFFLISLLLMVSLFSCKNNTDDDQKDEIPTAMVTFFNLSSYNVIIHRDSFYGPTIAQVNNINRETKVPVAVNNKTTVFSIEYIITPGNDDFNNETGEIFVSCYDPDIQIPVELKTNKPVTIQIPQPLNLVCKSAFIKIINTHSMPIRLRYSATSLKQTNNTSQIESGKQGIYKVDNIPNDGEHCKYYNISTTFDETFFSDFIIQNGAYITKNAYIYNFTFNGSIIEKIAERTLVFN